jgi:hypothetical protein
MNYSIWLLYGFIVDSVVITLLTYHLSQGAETAVKWKGTTMDPFAVSQGVRQGGVLSTDLYKLYINPLLDQIEDSGIDMQIPDRNNFLYRLV